MRLIDADKFEMIGETLPDYLPDDSAHAYIDGMERVLDIIDAAPTIDAVLVVRCGECKWGRTVRECSEYVWCGKPFAPPWASYKEDWYCADGKPKEDD